MYCKTCGYEAHEGCCDGCVGHTTDGYCVTEELLEVQNRVPAGGDQKETNPSV